MDICTFVTGMTTTLLACMSQPHCEVSRDGQRQFCMPAQSVPCESFSTPHYECVRPNKTTYRLPWTANNDAFDTVGRPQ